MARNELHLNFYQLYVLTKDPFFPKDAVSGPDKQRLLEKEYRCLNRHQQTQIYSAALTLTKYVWIGALVGLGVGGTLAAKFRQSRSRITKAYKQLEHLPLVHFPHAKGEIMSNLGPTVNRSRMATVATYLFLGLGGVYLGAALGLQRGRSVVNQNLNQSMVCRTRVALAYHAYRGAVLRKVAEDLDETTEKYNRAAAAFKSGPDDNDELS